ncbi:MAG: WD40 repeat domain-containing protein, partial [Chloroflexi bacterium]|nr:WD40 repeat domain-containing protein [Chloroflexota bacterium]
MMTMHFKPSPIVFRARGRGLVAAGLALLVVGFVAAGHHTLPLIRMPVPVTGTRPANLAHTSRCLLILKDPPKDYDEIYSAVFSPDGSEIVTASLNKVARLWDARTGRLIATLRGHTGEVRSAVFSPDGTRILTASEDNTARLWDSRTGKPAGALSGPIYRSCASFSPDGREIVTVGSRNTARVWDAQTLRPIATLAGHTDDVFFAGFSPDGKLIVTGSQDNTA